MTNGFFHMGCLRKTGTRHQVRGIGCEDAVKVLYSPDAKAAAAVLSDGAGSCEMAADGSRITAEMAAAVVTEHFDQLYEMPEQEAAQFILDYIREALRSEAHQHGFSDIIPYSATLLCAVLADDGRYLYFHVGDGVIAGCDSSGKCRILSEYEHEIAANVTTFVTLENTEYHFQRGQGTYSEFILMSDGPEQHLKYGRELTRRGDLLAALSYFYDETAIVEELRFLMDELQENGMTDDGSVALIADKRCAGDVFFHMDSDTMEALFGISKSSMNKSTRIWYRQLFQILANEEQISEKELGKRLHMHRHTDKVFSRLKCFLERGILQLLEQSQYRFP